MHITKEQILQHATELANIAIKDMGINACKWIIGDCDLLDQEHILDLLMIQISPEMVVIGDWRNNKNDVYDIVIRFAENKFQRIRHKKYSIGTYVVIMTNPINN